MTSNDTDVLVVGQGLAGTLLAFELIDKGFSVKIIDDNHATSASLVGTAVINPVTGRRYAKSWNIDELLPLAKVVYSKIEKTLDQKYLQSAEILQVLPDARIEEIWMMRAADPEFQAYLNKDIFAFSCAGAEQVQCARILQAFHVHVTRLMVDARDKFKTEGILVQQKFDPSRVSIFANAIQYEEIPYGHIVFCTGSQIRGNPFFDWLEIFPMKGEYLICRIPGLDLRYHLKYNISIIPLEKNLFWCGSTYDRYNDKPSPTSFGRDELLRKLRQVITAEIHVEHHRTGIRATTRDRRPYVGTHPEHPNVHVITGLGTKGASLAPYCANVMADYLTLGKPIPEDVNASRYLN